MAMSMSRLLLKSPGLLDQKVLGSSCNQIKKLLSFDSIGIIKTRKFHLVSKGNVWPNKKLSLLDIKNVYLPSLLGPESFHILQPFGVNHFSLTLTSKQNAEDTDDGQKLAQLSPKLGIMYTCKVCGTRNAHTFSRKSYTEGVVIVQCESCKNNHLIADNLGWFDDVKQRNIEEMLKDKGEIVKRITELDIPEELREKIESSLSEKLNINTQQGMSSKEHVKDENDIYKNNNNDDSEKI